MSRDKNALLPAASSPFMGSNREGWNSWGVSNHKRPIRVLPTTLVPHNSVSPGRGTNRSPITQRFGTG